jgi:hypothetical protein
LGHNPPGDAGAAALAAAPSLGRLTDLNLFAARLADAPHLGRLTLPDLTMNEIGATGCEALRRRFGAGVRLEHQRHRR